MSLQGKTAVVVGGGTGIGSGIALALANAGCRVVIGGRREDKLQETAKQFSGEPSILCKAVDVGERDDVNAFFAWCTEQLGQIDILVNSAGVNIPKRTMAVLSPDDWDKLMRINATGAYNCMYAVLPAMRERKDGLIINISSVSGVRASMLGGVAYCASKFAMSALSLTVGLEVKHDGVRITNIYPGEVETPILDLRPEPVSAERRATMLQPEDLGAAVLMVAQLPPRAHIPELVIKPTNQEFA